MKPQVFAKLMDFFAEGSPTVTSEPVESDTTIKYVKHVKLVAKVL
jgi:hypothetical protein